MWKSPVTLAVIGFFCPRDSEKLSAGEPVFCGIRGGLSTGRVGDVSQWRKMTENRPFSVDSVERDRCDIPVENFAESGKIMRKTCAATVFSQAVENVLHNLDFPCKIRKICPFLCILTHTFPQSVFGILHVVPTCGKLCEKAAFEQCFLWNGVWKEENVGDMSYQ